MKTRHFYTSEDELREFIDSVPFLTCPYCYASGAFILHGYLKVYSNSGEKNGLIRGRRIICNRRGPHGGCGRTQSILSAEYIYSFTITASQIWAFYLGVFEQGFSKRQAFSRLNLNMSESMPYHLIRCLRRSLCNIQTILRRAGYTSDPPGVYHNPLALLFQRIKTYFDFSPVATFQQSTQRSFL